MDGSSQDIESRLREAKRRAEERAEARLKKFHARLKKQLEAMDKQLEERDKELEEMDKQLAERDKQLEEINKQLRSTNLDEYIEACHNLVYTKLKVEPDLNKSTTGTIPLHYDKLFPRRLMPWTDFHDQQSEIFSTVYQHFEFEKRLFDNIAYLETVGKKTLNAPIASERMLRMFLDTCIEDPVRCIVKELSRSKRFQREFKIGHGIAFEHHFKALDDSSYTGINQQLRQSPSTPQELEKVEKRQKTRDPVEDSPRLDTQKICVYLYEEEWIRKRRPIAILEHKPPHKLSLPLLRAGLRETDMMEVVTGSKIANDEEATFNHCATELVGSAITEVFHYMVKSGLAYGLLTTGEGIVFLKLDWNNPQTVYYHLAEPTEEVSSHENDLSYSAVSQHLGFHLLALRDYGYHGQDVRKKAIDRLSTWTTGSQKGASTARIDQQKPPLTSPSDNPSPSERQTGRRSARIAERYSDGRWGPGASAGQGSNQSEFEGKSHQDLEYCTQKCILGLVKGDILDPDCPNLRLHQHQNNQSGVINTDERHPINHSRFLELLFYQLECTLDYGITSLGITGARGALFKVTLLAYGYTFIGKGTIQAFIPALQQEARVYEQLENIQGVHVPVFLGAINLQSLGRTYYYDFDVDIVHLCFMSWGGLSLGDAQHPDWRTLQPMAVKAMSAIHQEGVVHRDPRYENILFNPQTEQLMLIDFERSELVNMSRPALAPVAPNKRPRDQDWKGQTESISDSQSRDLPRRVRIGFSEDLERVKANF